MKRGAILCSVLAAVAFGGCSGGPSERSTRTASDALNSSRGTEFWLMFEQNYAGAVQLTLFIAGERATSGRVDVPGLGFSQVFTVTPGAVTSIALPPSDYATGSGNVENKGIHVTAQDEITVYGLNRQQYTTDAFLGLPVDILGTEYLALGYGNTYASSEFGVVATADGTTVTVTPAVATSGHAAGVPFTVALNAGQVVQFQSGGPGDLSGSIVQANHPVGVFAGHTCTTIPDTLTGYCDHVVEQMPPTTTWGRRFLTVPLATRTRGDTFRFLAATSGTTVTVNGALVATLSRGQFHQQELAVPALVEASAPILVAQYSNGTTWDGVTSDPFMMLIPPYEQFLASYTVTTPASGFRTNYINVVAPAAAVGVLTLDAAVVPSTSFTPIGTTGFLGAQLPVGLGAHNLAANRPFGVFVYGFDDADSYGYPGGMSLAKVATVTTVTLTPATATARVGEPQCFDATVRDQDGLAVPGVRVDFTVTGASAVSGFATASASGVAQLCYAGAAVGVDQVVGAVGLIQGTAAMTWTPLAPGVETGGPYAVDEGGQLKLYASSTLPGTLEYAWDLDGDGVFESWGDVAWLDAARIDGPAVLAVAVRVRNELGDEAVGRTTVTVRNVAPTGNLYISSQYRPEGSTFTLSLGSVTDAAAADRPGIRVAFDCGDGKGFGPLGTVKTFTCTATDDGDRDVGARLVDKDGGVREYWQKVRVYNRAPVATIAAPASLTTFAVGAPVDLLVRFTDAGALDTHRCLVTWGDGTAEAGVVTEAGGAGTCAATHVFPTSGTFKIIVNVSDNAGDDTTRYVTVYVK